MVVFTGSASFISLAFTAAARRGARGLRSEGLTEGYQVSDQPWPNPETQFDPRKPSPTIGTPSPFLQARHTPGRYCAVRQNAALITPLTRPASSAPRSCFPIERMPLRVIPVSYCYCPVASPCLIRQWLRGTGPSLYKSTRERCAASRNFGPFRLSFLTALSPRCTVALGRKQAPNSN